MRSHELLFLQMQLNIITHLKFVRNSMLAMSLIVLGIGFLKNVMDSLSNVLKQFNRLSGLVLLSVSMGRFLLC